MKINLENFLNQLGDMVIDDMLDDICVDMSDKDAMILKKSLDVFAKYNIPKMNAIHIILELGKVADLDVKKPTKYVCDHCGKEFDKYFPNIESVMAYHLETEHINEIESSVIEDNFTEE